MNCSFCHGHSRESRKMSREELSLVLDKLCDVTKHVYFHLMGEPLTHPELPEFIKMAVERGFKPMITTNGTLLSRRGSEILTSSGESNPKEQAKSEQSGESAAKDQVKSEQSGESAANNSSKPYLHKINISLHSFEGDDEARHEKYLSEIADFAQKAANEGTIVVLRLWNKGFDGGKNGLVLDYLRKNINGEWAENTRGLRIREKLFLEWGDRFGWPDRDAEIQGDEVTCYGLRDHFGILSDGTIVPCCLDSDGVIALGNAFTDDVNTVLSSERAVAMKRGFECRYATEELCKRCQYAQRFV